MKKSRLLCFALALAPIGAMAADLAPAPRAAVAVAPVSPWAGFYGGFSVGWNWGSNGSTVTLPQAAAGQPGFVGDAFRGPAFIAGQNQLSTRSTECANDISCSVVDGSFAFPANGVLGRESEKGGGVISLNAGYNWQFGSFVLGVEGDLSAMNRRYESAYASPVGTADYLVDFNTVGGSLGWEYRGNYSIDSAFATRSRMEWLTTARLRAGFAAGDFLIYATGGLAAGRSSMSMSGAINEQFVETRLNNTVASPVDAVTPAGIYRVTSVTNYRGSTNGGTDFGWAVGGGVEWMTGRGFSIKAEYLYYDLGAQTLIATGTTATTVGTGPAGTVTASTTTTAAAAPIRIRQSVDGQIFRVGLNFGFPVASRGAVVAAY